MFRKKQKRKKNNHENDEALPIEENREIIAKASIMNSIAELDLQILLKLNCLSLAAITCVNKYYGQLSENTSLSKIRFFDKNNEFVHSKQINPFHHERNRIGNSYSALFASQWRVPASAPSILKNVVIVGEDESEKSSLVRFIHDLNRRRIQPNYHKINWQIKTPFPKQYDSFEEEGEDFKLSRLHASDAGIVLIDISSESYDEKSLNILIKTHSKTLFPHIYSNAPIFLVGTKADLVYDSSRIYLLKNVAKQYDFINACLAISIHDKANCDGLFFELGRLLLEKTEFFIEKSTPDEEENKVKKKEKCTLM